MRSHPGRAKHLAFAAFTLGLTVTVCYLIIEHVFAAYYYSNTAEIADKTFDPLLGWRLKPGTFWVKPPNGFRKVRIDINRLGLRNRPLSPVAENHTRRIIVLGDSFTFAQVTRTEDLFTIRLEELLNGRGERYEVINAGVPGYGNSQELLLMKRLADDGVVADIYLLMLFTNDILDNLRLGYEDLDEDLVRPGFALNQSGRVKLEQLPVQMVTDTSGTLIPVRARPPKTMAIQVLKSRIESEVQTRPTLLRLLMRLGVEVRFPRMPGLLNGWYREEVLAAGIPLMGGLIEEIRDEAERREARLLVGIIPSPLQVYPDVYGPLLERTFPDSELVDAWLEDSMRPQVMMGDICRDLSISFLNLHPALSADDEGILFIPREGHFTSRGHFIVAHSLSSFILENFD
jgi:hypothetical protein